MHYNPYAIARFLFAGALVLSIVSFIITLQWGWLSSTAAWAMVLIYENVRRTLFRMLIKLREAGLIEVIERDDLDINDGK